MSTFSTQLVHFLISCRWDVIAHCEKWLLINPFNASVDCYHGRELSYLQSL